MKGVEVKREWGAQGETRDEGNSWWPIHSRLAMGGASPHSQAQAPLPDAHWPPAARSPRRVGLGLLHGFLGLVLSRLAVAANAQCPQQRLVLARKARLGQRGLVLAVVECDVVLDAVAVPRGARDRDLLRGGLFVRGDDHIQLDGVHLGRSPASAPSLEAEKEAPPRDAPGGPRVRSTPTRRTQLKELGPRGTGPADLVDAARA